MKTKLLLSIVTIVFFLKSNAQDVYSFTYDNRTYQIVKIAKKWTDAAADAVARGGKLAEVNNDAEQVAIFAELKLDGTDGRVGNNRAGIEVGANSKTTGADGGYIPPSYSYTGSYVWLGGNDIATEGTWIWDGTNSGAGTTFWSGDGATGGPVGGLYNNWLPYGSAAAKEPNNSGGVDQDGLAMGIDGWNETAPDQVKLGRWNSLNANDKLFYVVEYDRLLSTEDIEFNKNITIYPNPTTDYLVVKINKFSLKNIEIFNLLGKKVKTIKPQDEHLVNINLEELSKGVYLIKIISKEGIETINKFIKK